MHYVVWTHILTLCVGIAIGCVIVTLIAKDNVAFVGHTTGLQPISRHLNSEEDDRSADTDNRLTHHQPSKAHQQFRKSRKYFIDLGANKGNAIRHFVTPKVQDEIVNGMYNYEIKGHGSAGDWHVVAVEANPLYTSRLQLLRSQYLADKKVLSFELFSGTALYTR